MTNEPRKASDILLSLESDMKQLIALYRSQDLVLKVLANKLSTTLDVMNNLQVVVESLQPNASVKPKQEIYNPHALKVSSEFQLPVEAAPKGFRRTSRPETYDIEKPAVKTPPRNIPIPPAVVQVPAESEQFFDYNANVIAQPTVPVVKKPKPEMDQAQTMPSYENKIPVQQRLVDKNGKAIFLANVEIFNTQSGNSEFKGRTNGIGKWQAALIPGHYQVKINKQESVSKEKIELVQNIIVDGLSPTQELPVLICK